MTEELPTEQPHLNAEPRTTPLVNSKGETHPIATRHAWGEDRGWCRDCGEPIWIDDVALSVYHVGVDGMASRRQCPAALRHSGMPRL